MGSDLVGASTLAQKSKPFRRSLALGTASALEVSYRWKSFRASRVLMAALGSAESAGGFPRLRKRRIPPAASRPWLDHSGRKRRRRRQWQRALLGRHRTRRAGSDGPISPWQRSRVAWSGKAT